MFKVSISSRADKEFAKLSSNLKQKFYEEFKRIAQDLFRHPNVEKIRETERGYRLRIGRWRILFSF